jgi:hypothetical protein
MAPDEAGVMKLRKDSTLYELDRTLIDNASRESRLDTLAEPGFLPTPGGPDRSG